MANEQAHSAVPARIRFVRLSTRRVVVGISVAALVVGCGSSRTAMLSRADVRPIAKVRPTTRGWDWPQRPTHERLDEACDGWRWQNYEKLGVTSACLFESAKDAHEGLPRASVCAKWAKRTVAGSGGHFTRRPTRRARRGSVEDSGQLLHRAGGDIRMATGQPHDAGPRPGASRTCPSGIRSAARAWGDAIDHEARTRQ